MLLYLNVTLKVAILIILDALIPFVSAVLLLFDLGRIIHSHGLRAQTNASHV